MKKPRVGVYWFTNDLRLHDNSALSKASKSVDELLCVYVKDFAWRSSSLYPPSNQFSASNRFLRESLMDLSQELKAIGQRLVVVESKTVSALKQLFIQVDATDIFRSDNQGWYENRIWEMLKEVLQKSTPEVRFHSIDTHTLFNLETLPFDLQELPISFTKFKKEMAEIKPLKPIQRIIALPPPPSAFVAASVSSYLNLSSSNSLSLDGGRSMASNDEENTSPFKGGETQGVAVLRDYFASKKPGYYKEVRNAIDGWDNSTKLSPWLASGSLSVRQVAAKLFEYEENITKNNSTYWIYFELLWREYFQWYALKHGTKLFSFNGIKKLSPLNSYYPERFQKWVNSSTPYPIVNACMNELRKTGFLSNRGRQIVASCFVNELAMDWRYGAAYFEHVLIDYDVGSNWGNWQYLAGVGADTKDKRHFNLEKQTQMFDPDGRYIKEWGEVVPIQPLDSVDAADWPIE